MVNVLELEVQVGKIGDEEEGVDRAGRQTLPGTLTQH